MGSGVVWLKGALHAPCTPVVPKLIADSPNSLQICRQKLATEVLPLVPVTATITSGCAPKNKAEAAASAWRGSSTTQICAAWSGQVLEIHAAPSGSVKIALAPWRRAY